MKGVGTQFIWEDKIELKSGLDVAERGEVQSRSGDALSIPLDPRCGFGPARPTLTQKREVSGEFPTLGRPKHAATHRLDSVLNLELGERKFWSS